MAINPGSLFPTKTIPASSPDWPFGEPKNIATAGDGTGTPWEVSIVKDLFGLQQALLIRAGITPTGTPETADKSQYADAMSALFGRQFSATLDALTVSLDEATGLQTLGFAVQGDGGDALWLATGITTPGKAGTTELSLGFIYDADGRQFELVTGEINPRQLGAIGDGVANDQPAFQAAATLQVARGGGVIRVTAGRYFLDSQLTLGDKVVLQGSGAGSTVVTFDGATGSFPSACIFATGSSVALPALSADVDVGDTTIDFSSAHGLVDDDLFYILDPRNESYASESIEERAGEFFVCTDVPSSTAILSDRPAIATTSIAVTGSATGYDFTQVETNKVTPVRCSVRQITLEGISPTSTTRVLVIAFGRQCVIADVDLQSAAASAVQLEICYDTVIQNVRLRMAAGGGGASNGINLVYCQQVDISYVTGVSEQSPIGVTFKGGLAGPVNRWINISHCDLSSTGTLGNAIRLRANTEYLAVVDSILAGIRLAGDRITLRDCDVRSSPFSGGLGVFISNMTGGNWLIENCRIEARVNMVSSDALFQLDAGVDNVDRPGTVTLKNVAVDMSTFTGFSMKFKAGDSVDFNSLLLDQVEVDGAGASPSHLVIIDARSLAAWDAVTIQNCNFRNVPVVATGYQTITVRNTVFLSSRANGLLLDEPLALHPFALRTASIESCHASGHFDAGIRILDQAIEVRCAFTTSLNNSLAASSATRSSLSFDPVGSAGAPRLVLKSNVFGDDQASPTQGFAYHYTSLVDFVEDSDTIILGGVPVSRGAVASEKISSVWDTNTDVTEFTGRVEVSGGDVANAPGDADDVVIGKGSGNRGIYIESGSTGSSRLMMGDTGVQNRFEFVADHSSDEFKMRIFGVTVTEWAVGEFRPLVTDTILLGAALRRWEAIYGGRLHGSRVFLDNGTTLVPATHIALSAGFGVSASASNSTGRDSILQVLVDTGGSGTGANPIVTYTYPSGTTPTSKVPFVQVTPFGTVFSDWQVKSATSTQCEIQFKGTPAISTTYGVNVALVWADA